MSRAAIIDSRVSEEIQKNLSNLGLEIILMPPSSLVAEPISSHPDIQLFIHGNTAFLQPEIPLDFIRSIEKYCDIHLCSIKPGSEYPLDIAYNIACTGNTAIHKISETAPEIKKYFSEKNINLINTAQGYTRCSTLIVDSNSIITADKSIYKASVSSGIDSLLITPGFIDLPGYKYGFIGGTSGVLDKTVLFSGTIDHHPDSVTIREFIENRGMSMRYLSCNPAVDIGTIFIV